MPVSRRRSVAIQDIRTSVPLVGTIYVAAAGGTVEFSTLNVRLSQAD